MSKFINKIIMLSIKNKLLDQFNLFLKTWIQSTFDINKQ